MHHARLIFVTGLSGSGKTMASRILEDLGYYALDNLPSSLILKFVELLAQSEEEIPRAVLVVDLRDRNFPRDFPRAFLQIKEQGHDASLLYLEAADEALVRRFSETRRPHPLAADSTITQAILQEREALSPIRALADRVVDTTSLTVHSLRERVVEWVGAREQAVLPITLTLLTFGFKYGIPRDADWVFDVRFLRNPFFVPGLREMSGKDEPVQRHVLGSEAADSFIGGVCDILRRVVPLYAREGRTHLTVAIGCTGGRHRSVAISQKLRERLAAPDTRINAIDRDIDKG